MCRNQEEEEEEDPGHRRVRVSSGPSVFVVPEVAISVFYVVSMHLRRVQTNRGLPRAYFAPPTHNTWSTPLQLGILFY